MKKSYSIGLFLLLFVSFLCADVFSQSGVYVGGHIRRERPNTITNLKSSGFNYVILFNVNVEPDGTLTTDGDTICANGKYVFDKKQPYYISDIKNLKKQPTSIERLEICIGGWGNQSYQNIKNLINSVGNGSATVLYRNFKVLKDSLPVLDAVNNDDEFAYDLSTAVRFHVMMAKLGYQSTLAPYTNKTYWTSLSKGINDSIAGTVDRILIQCYDGGAGNDPGSWHLNGIPLHAGRLNYQDFNETVSVMTTWKSSRAVVGGFFWVYNDETWNLSKYAIAANKIYGSIPVVPADSAAAVFCEDINYGGYNVNFKAGRYTTLDMVRLGLVNKDVSSLKVTPGYKVTLYSQDNFTGDSLVVTEDLNWVGDAFNDKTVSLKIVSTTTGLSNPYKIRKYSVYPNPAIDYVIVKTNEDDVLKITDIGGRIVAVQTLKAGENNVSLANVAEGIYFLSFNNSRNEKLIVSK